MSHKKLFGKIIDEVMAIQSGGDPRWIKREVNARLHDEGLADAYECEVRIDKSHAWENRLSVGIMPRSAIDQLAAVGNKGRALAAYKRGIRDHDRLVSGEISTDELVEELSADPP